MPIIHEFDYLKPGHVARGGETAGPVCQTPAILAGGTDLIALINDGTRNAGGRGRHQRDSRPGQDRIQERRPHHRRAGHFQRPARFAVIVKEVPGDPRDDRLGGVGGHPEPGHDGRQPLLGRAVLDSGPILLVYDARADQAGPAGKREIPLPSGFSGRAKPF